MKQPTTTDPDYVVESIDVDGIVARALLCTYNPTRSYDGLPCFAHAEGSSQWLGGVVDERTHTYLLRCVVADGCEYPTCPHRDALAASRGSR